jgi:hypothetical protein
MNCRLSILVAIAWCIAVHANPRPLEIVDWHVYLYSERVVVSLSPNDARVIAEFTFRFEPEKRRLLKKFPTSIQVPIWLPNDAPEDDSVAAFWHAFGSKPVHTLNETNHDAFADALMFRALLKGQKVEVEDFVTYSSGLKAHTRHMLERSRLRAEVQHFADEGVGCVIIGLQCNSMLLRGDNPLIVSYRQPHVQTGQLRRFLYLPAFYGLPKNATTSDPARYSITLRADSGCLVQVTQGSKQYCLDPGESIELTPVHHEAIAATIDAGSNQPLQPTRPSLDVSCDP